MPAGELPQDLLWDVTLKTAVVLAVLYAALWVFRRSLGRTAGGHCGSALTVLQSAHLGPGRSVHVLGIGNRRLLVGATSHQVSLLVELGAADADVSVADQAEMVPLQQQLRRAANAVGSVPALLRKTQEKGNDRHG